MSGILTNSADTSVILTFANTSTAVPTVVSLGPNESVLTSSILVTDTADANYNGALIQEYIDSGILLNETLTSIKQSELQVLSQGNLTVKLTSGIPELLSKGIVSGIDNTQILPVTDATGQLLCIYYKSNQGMSISVDAGATQTLISNANLLFPDEITSFAAQAYDSNDGILTPIARLFIGTLREGVKTYTPGIDTTYIDFESDASFDEPTQLATDRSYPIFKTSTRTTLALNTIVLDPITSAVTSDTYSYEYVKTFPKFCATFILGIANNPINSGCPIFIATRPWHTETIIETYITLQGGVIIDNPPPDTSSTTTTQTKIVCKYLHDRVYSDSVYTVTPFIHTTSPTVPKYNRWIKLQENLTVNPDTQVPDIITKPLFPQNVLDVVTEYTPTGFIFITKDSTGTNNLYELTNSTGISTIPLEITEIESLPGNLQTETIKNVSYLKETASDNRNIFITTNTEVWRGYASTPAWEWAEFIWAGAATQDINGVVSNAYFDTNLDNGALTWDGAIGHLQDLSNFVITAKPNTVNGYLGLLGTELGLYFYDLKLVNNTFIFGSKTTRNVLYNVAKTAVSDIKLLVFGQNIYSFVCSYASHIPKTYNDNTNYLRLLNDNSALTTDVYYIKPAVETEYVDSLYYINNSSRNQLGLSIPSDEQVFFYSTDAVFINNFYPYTGLVSPSFDFKVSYFDYDTILQNNLYSMLAYKYYKPVITERIVSSINKIELSILQLNEYKHSIKFNQLQSIQNTLSAVGDIKQICLGDTKVVLADTFDFNIDSSLMTSFVCIRNDGKVIVPTTIRTANNASTSENPITHIITTTYQYITTILFSEPFYGTIFTTSLTGAADSAFAVSGLFKTITHSKNRYPQVILDATVAAKLNDIKYIDDHRLEISFTSAVDTTVYLR